MIPKNPVGGQNGGQKPDEDLFAAGEEGFQSFSQHIG